MALQPNFINAADIADSTSPRTSIMSKIENAPEDVVRAILIGLCQDPNQEQKAMEHFMKLDGLKSRELVKSGDILYESTEESRNDSRINGIGGKKRRALTEILMCAKCDKPFIEDENYSTACLYHIDLFSGDIRKNDESSVWDDWEDWRQGDPYSKENRKEYPEGYIWQCCKKDNTNAGCMTGPHAVLYKKPLPPALGRYLASA